MSSTTHARSKALAGVCLLVTQAEEGGHISVPVASLRVALDGVDVEGLAHPRPCQVGNVGHRFSVHDSCVRAPTNSTF